MQQQSRRARIFRGCHANDVSARQLCSFASLTFAHRSASSALWLDSLVKFYFTAMAHGKYYFIW